jgi:pimeloyl-ACP methyl ester carboxylesterase
MIRSSKRFRRLTRTGAGLVAIAGVVAGMACGTTHRWLPNIIARAPNAGKTMDVAGDESPAELRHLGVERQLRIEVGPPTASLSVWVLESNAPRATVLMLHGVRDNKQSLLRVGRRLAGAGYRVVLVDSRGHGRSSGEWLTYGMQESRDLVRVLDALTGEGLVAGPVGVYGVSYGAATAIQFAALEPRVKAVVAVAPFREMTSEVNHYVRRLWWVPIWAVSKEEVAQAIARAGVMAGFDPLGADVVQAIQQTEAPVLLIHGRQDRLVPVGDSQQLHAVAGTYSELLILRWDGHFTALHDPVGSVSRAAVNWFNHQLKAQ